MERELNDVNDYVSPDDLAEMEKKRIESLDEAGINEEDVLEQAKDERNTFQNYFNENIVRGKDDMNFTLRDQWTAVERSEFTRLFKPAMTDNKLYDPVKKIIGEQRRNKPDLIVRSLTGKASQEQIDLRADLLRTIAYQSQNDLVYQAAFKSALLMGFGAFQICIDYESPRSFNKIIRYDTINDASRCSFDPKALKPHKGDGDWCSRDYLFGRKEFFATYPYITNPTSFMDAGQQLDFTWMTKDSIMVCDYFRKDWYPIKMYLVSIGNNQTMSVDEFQWEKMQKKLKTMLDVTEDAEVAKIVMRNMPRVISERQSQDYQIMHYRLIRNQIIDFSVWPSRQLPIIFVDGDSYFIEGRQYTRSFIHEARDMQKLLNYARSELAAELKNRRREQWIGTPDNIIGQEQMWRNPELQTGILMAKPDPKTGQMPTKMNAWEVSQALFEAAQATTQDIREILGFSETDILQGRDMSGKARRERKTEGAMSSYVYTNNLEQAMEQGGRVVNDLLPHIIGENERTMQVSRKNGQTDMVTFNKKLPNGDIENYLEDGEFDVEIAVGPSYAVQKEIALEMFAETIKAYPQAFPLVADLWVENLDIQKAQILKERFKSMVPPEILAKEEGKPMPPPKPNPQEQMVQMEMMAKQAEIKNKMQEIELKKRKLDLEAQELILKAQETESKGQIDLMKHGLDVEEARIVHGHDRHKMDLDHTHDMAKILADLHKFENPPKIAKANPTSRAKE